MRFALLLIPLLLLTGCDPKRIDGPIGGDRGIPFDLVVPVPLADADYYVMAGTIGRQQSSLVADSIIEVTIWSHYAQFLPAPSGMTDFDVRVNQFRLDRHLGGDTLRLRSGDDSELRTGNQIWSLRDSADDSELGRFILPSVGLLDTVGPFPEIVRSRRPIRSDTAFTLRWASGGGGVIAIEWVTDNNRVVQTAQDFSGAHTMLAGTMSTLRGRGTVRVTRFRGINEETGGKTITGIRMSQVVYEVTVQ